MQRTYLPWLMALAVFLSQGSMVAAGPLLTANAKVGHLSADDFDEILEATLRTSAVIAADALCRQELEKAILAFRDGRSDDALSALKTASEINSALPLAEIMLARLFRASEQKAQGQTLLEELAFERPTYSGVFLEFGELALAEGRISDADLNFAKAKALADDTLPQAEKVRLMSGAAAVAEARADWLIAETELKELLELDTANAAAYLRLARVLVRQDKVGEAQALLAAATNENNAATPAPLTIAQLLTEAGRAEEAQPWMVRTIKEHPTNAVARVAVAAWHFEQGDAPAALAHLAAAKKLDKELPGIGRLEGLAHLAAGDPMSAELAFESLHRSSPGDPETANLLAQSLLAQNDQGKVRRALELAAINLRQYPNSAPAAATLGRAYLEAGRLEEAERLLAGAVSQGHATSEAVFDLARTFAARGRSAEARRLAEQAVAAGGPFLRRRQAEAWLETLPGRTDPVEPAKN